MTAALNIASIASRACLQEPSHLTHCHPQMRRLHQPQKTIYVPWCRCAAPWCDPFALHSALLPSSPHPLLPSMAVPPVWLRPVVDVQRDTVRLGVETSHGGDFTLTLSNDWVESYSFGIEYYNHPDGSMNVQVIATVETVTGDVFRVGAVTMNQAPWVRPITGGKGYGRGAAPAPIITGAGIGAVVHPPSH